MRLGRTDSMKTTIARILLPFLLLAQVGAGMSPGRVLCIAIDCCCGAGIAHHEHVHPHGAHDGHHHHGAAADHDHRQKSDAPRGAALAAADDCACHLHVSMPDDVGTAGDRAVERVVDVRLLEPALVEHLPALDERGCSEPPEAPPRWCWLACDQCRARAVTRLLI